MSTSQRAEVACIWECLDLITSPVSLKWAKIRQMLLEETSEYIAVSSIDIVEARWMMIHWVVSGINFP
jgi:hypothetical protein